MRTYTTPLRLLLFTILVLALGSGAAWGDVHRHYDKGKSADADFSFEDASGCISTSVFVLVSIGQNNVEIEGSRGTVGLVRTNRCAGGQTLLNLWGDMTPDSGEMQFKGHLDSATFTVTFTARDAVSGMIRTVRVNLLWTAAGQGEQTFDRVSNFTTDYRSTYLQHGLSRPAQATGSITMDGEEMILGPSSDASVTDYDMRVIEIYD